MTKLKAGAVELNVVDQGGGQNVIFIHGFPLDHTMWNHQIEYFTHRARVVAVDLRGFGGSQVVPGTSSMEQMADDIAAMMDTMGIHDRVVLCGLSMGGYVAFQFWKKYSRRVRALVLCDTRAIGDTPEAAAGRQKTAESVLQSGPKGLADAMLPKLFAPDTISGNAGIVAATRKVIEGTAPEGIAAALRGMAVRPNVTAMLPEISAPTLVVGGEHDAISPAEEMRGFAAEIPDATFVPIPKAGHMAPLENPQAFNETLEGFLTRLSQF